VTTSGPPQFFKVLLLFAVAFALGIVVWVGIVLSTRKGWGKKIMGGSLLGILFIYLTLGRGASTMLEAIGYVGTAEDSWILGEPGKGG
jgi:hypothetical protein